MEIARAIRIAAPGAPASAIDGLAMADLGQTGALRTALRAAHLIGQCAHESAGFRQVVESLHYSSGTRIFAVFGRRHFRSLAHAECFARNPAGLANHVYARRMGNGPPESGDGFRYRGRGYLQLTGRANYRTFGKRIGIDLEAFPERAEVPSVAWAIAAHYLAVRRRGGRTALDWADRDNAEMVTRIVNGGLNGLADRRHRTALALSVLGPGPGAPRLHAGDEGASVLRLQHLLAGAGFNPGPLDGDFGPRTRGALIRFQRGLGLPPSGDADPATWRALNRTFA